MPDSERCRATAARYARLADLTRDAERRRSYRELEGLWLEMAFWADKLNLKDDAGARRRLYDLADRAGQAGQGVPLLH